jgi:glyoxylase-like metal-dependent hydrolase (beta-lactamase superfamily II)
MPRIPLEDNFTDVLGKAQRGWRIGDASLVRSAGITPEELAAVRTGEIRERVLRALAGPLRLNAGALLALARREWYPEQPLFPRGFAMFNTAYGDMTVNSYLVWDPKTRLAAAFDTGANCGSMLAFMRAEGLQLRNIFLTHTHEDHIADLPRLAAETGAEIWASELEPAPGPAAKTFKENAHFHLGAIAIKTLLTWGHSPGQTTYYVTGLSWQLAVVGDSLFAGSIGGSRTHFAEQYRHDRAKIFSLPPDTVLACGHGPLTTVRQERLHNPFFCRST